MMREDSLTSNCARLRSFRRGAGYMWRGFHEVNVSSSLPLSVRQGEGGTTAAAEDEKRIRNHEQPQELD